MSKQETKTKEQTVKGIIAFISRNRELAESMNITLNENDDYDEYLEDNK